MRYSFLRFLLPAVAVSLAASFALLTERRAFATAGLAEWEVATPGGNRISHIDPLKERYGTCLRKADDQPGMVLDDPSRVYADQLEWWQYYPRHVLGKARQGWFIFDESTARLEYFKSEQDLTHDIDHRKLGKPLSRRMTPADGWNEAWMPAIRDRCTQVSQDARADGELSDSVRQALRKYCDQMAAPLNGR
jgi:hypothetical protein